MSLNWDIEALDNGDGPSTVVAYDDEGNELFYTQELEDGYWRAFIVKNHAFEFSEWISPLFPDRESAEKICEHFHELAEINHGYS
jgi:hypothetical protein